MTWRDEKWNEVEHKIIIQSAASDLDSKERLTRVDKNLNIDTWLDFWWSHVPVGVF